jgi:hypothetical protein
VTKGGNVHFQKVRGDIKIGFRIKSFFNNLTENHRNSVTQQLFRKMASLNAVIIILE